MSPAPLNIGNVPVGTSVFATEQVNNRSNVAIVIFAVSVVGTGFTGKVPTLPVTVSPGGSFPYLISFAPQAVGQVIGRSTVRFKWRDTSWHWSSRTVTLYGTGTTGSAGVLSPKPTSINFGSVQAGSSTTVTQALVNSGSAALTISQVTASGTGFSLSGINPPMTISPGQSASFSVRFAPVAGGSYSGSIGVASNASNSSVSIPLSGSSSLPGQLSITPSSVNFGSVVVGSSQKQSVALAATGGPVTVSAAGINNPAFSVSGLSLPLTIPAGTSSTLTLVFSPQSSGTINGNLSLTSTATNSPATGAMTGVGTAPTQHTVTLTWAPSTSTGVVGYNVYRSGVSGGPYVQINTALKTTATDLDNTVVAGQTYFYVVTAVNSNSQESTFSNQVKAVIPYP
jgi:hypothetical protein